MKATKISVEASGAIYWQKLKKIAENLSVKDSRVLIGRWLGTASTDSKHTRIRFLDLGKRQG